MMNFFAYLIVGYGLLVFYNDVYNYKKDKYPAIANVLSALTMTGALIWALWYLGTFSG